MISGRRTLSQALTQEILERIRCGTYRPGDRLPTGKGLMEEHSVGRNVAREAVQALVAMGIVDVRPGRGAVVLNFETRQALDAETISALLLDHTVDDLNEFRRVIEVEIAARAAERATAIDLATMRERLATFSSRYRAGISVVEPELGFHSAIAHASGNAVYEQVLDLLRDRLAAARTLVEDMDWANERAMQDHQAIYDAIAVHDVAGARAAMRKHMQLAFDAIAQARLRRDLVKPAGELDADGDAVCTPGLTTSDAI